jgi:phosphoserine phosphatase
LKQQLIFLVRHGQTNPNRDGKYQGIHINEGLNDTGTTQIKLLAAYMKKHELIPKHLYASSLNRTIDTLCIVKHELFGKKKAALISVPELQEINQGDWDGKTRKEAARLYPDLFNLWETNPMAVEFPNGETVQGARKRALKALHKILADNPKGHIFISCHGGINVQILAEILGASNIKSIHQYNACLNIIERSPNDQLKIRCMNQTAHLTT